MTKIDPTFKSSNGLSIPQAFRKSLETPVHSVFSVETNYQKNNKGLSN